MSTHLQVSQPASAVPFTGMYKCVQVITLRYQVMSICHTVYLLKTLICNYFSDNIPEIQTCVVVVVA